MKNFKFRLAQFLKIKEFEEKSAWNEVLKQETRTFNIKNKIDNLKMMITQSNQQMSQAGRPGGPDMATLQILQESVDAFKVRGQQLELELQTEMKTLERLQAKHRESKKETKIITNLRERKKSEFKDELNDKELKQTAEVAAQYYSRTRRGNV